MLSRGHRIANQLIVNKELRLSCTCMALTSCHEVLHPEHRAGMLLSN